MIEFTLKTMYQVTSTSIPLQIPFSVDDVWFPAVQEEKEVIWTTVKEFFGELKAFEFSIKGK